MPKFNIRCLIAAISLAVISTLSSAAPDSQGLVAIWKGHIDGPPSDGFVGTGFHIGDGFVVTAKHVVEDIGDEWFGVIASKSARGNRVGVVSPPTCFTDADICFFRLDPSDSSIQNKELSTPYGITCELPSPWPKVEMTGFSGESDGPKRFPEITIQAKAGTFQAPGGAVYRKMLQTDAQTSPGTSGSPVVLKGTRNAIGVHIAFSQNTNDQVVFPFYMLGEAIQIEGTKVFHPNDCAAGNHELEEPVVTTSCSHDDTHAVIIGNFRPPNGMSVPTERVKEVLDFNINTKLQEAQFLGEERLAFIPCEDARPSGSDLGKELARNLKAHALVYGDIGVDDQELFTVSTIIDDAYDMHPRSYRSLNKSVDLIFPAHASMNTSTYSAILSSVAAGFEHAENCPFAIATIAIIDKMPNEAPKPYQSVLDDLKNRCARSLPHNALLLD